MTSVIAHRGASRARRENTVEAFAEAARMGADAVELDARRTADDRLAVHHDARLSDGRIVCETAAADLPDTVALLPDALDACEGMWVNVEIKNSPGDPDFDAGDLVAELVLAELDGRDSPARWLVSSFNPDTINRCRVLQPEVRTALLVGDADDDAIEQCVVGGHAAIHPFVELLTGRQIQRCHDAGLAVNTWTCNEPARMAELVDAGVDGICTDVPDVLVAVLAGR